MVLDRRKTYELVQALLRVRDRKDGGNLLRNVAQTGTASGDRGYGEPVLGGMRFFSASQPGVTANDEAARQSHKPIPMPRPHPFRDPAGFSHPGEGADIAKARGIPAHEYPATYVAGARDSLATKMSSGGTGPYQIQADTENDSNDRGAQIDNLHRRSWGHGGPAKIISPGHRAPLLRVADGEPDMTKEALHHEKKMPEIHYKTSGEIWSDFLGGIGKGIAQGVVDVAFNSAKARRAMYTGVYTDTPTPVLFDPPTSWWDNTGRKIAPGIMVAIRPVPLRRPKTWGGKIIGKVTPPKHLKPGTAPFGNYMHKEIAKFLDESYPKTKFDIRVEPGQKGVDIEYQAHPDDLDPGFKYLDIKTNKPHSQKELNRQIQNWEYEEPTVRVITYDEQGNIYDGFGF